MIVKQTGIFKRRVKKLHKAEKESLDNAVKAIIDNPAIGQMKMGDLAGVQVYKFKHFTQQYLLAYQYVNDEVLLTFLELGTHENFYRDIKKN